MESKICSKCGEAKALAHFTVRKASKDGLRHSCRDCDHRANQAWQKNNPDRSRSIKQAWAESNSEKRAASRKAWSEANPEKHIESILKARARGVVKKSMANRARYLVHADRINAINKAWKAANRHKVLAMDANYRAKKLQATPQWASADSVEDFYLIARMLRMYTGQPYHVDHIVPLCSKLVCGLHCEANLQVIPGIENLQKSNSRWPDMP